MSTSNRIFMAFLGLALMAVVIGAVLIAPQGTGVALPDQIESISPTNGAIVLRQTRLEIDMAQGYVIEIAVDGTPIPQDQLIVVEQTGLYRWEPRSDTFIPEWSPGTHTIEIRWESTGQIPDPGVLIWTFVAQ